MAKQRPEARGGQRGHLAMEPRKEGGEQQEPGDQGKEGAVLELSVAEDRWGP